MTRTTRSRTRAGPRSSAGPSPTWRRCRARRLLDEAKDAAGYQAAVSVMQPILDEMAANGPFNNEELRKWAETPGENDPEDAAQFRGRVVNLADGVDRVRQNIIVQALRA